MSFAKYDEEGNLKRKRVVIDCSNDETKTEQSHKDEVDINAIVRRHGMDMIAKTSKVVALEYDENPDNNFEETMNMIAKAQSSFESLPHQVRKEFDNNPARFMDFVQNPNNADRMIELGLASKPVEIAPEAPIEVIITNPNGGETPPA